jgi:hypothetical protein
MPEWNEKQILGDYDQIKVLLARPYTVHPDDWHLSVVLCEVVFGVHPYATFMHNAQANAMFSGNYFKTKDEAFEDWKKR